MHSLTIHLPPQNDSLTSKALMPDQKNSLQEIKLAPLTARTQTIVAAENKTPPKRINVLSLDFDNCLANREFDKIINEKNALITANKILFEHIFKLNKQHKFNETVVLIGSNRQSKSVEDLNAHAYNCECFSKMQSITNHLQTKIPACKFDNFLMADLYNDLPPGKSFSLATSTTSFTGKHPDYIFDKSKITLLYAQIHKLASQYPTTDIMFDFYDDSSIILTKLTNYFLLHKDHLPKNVTLRLYEYSGEVTNNKLTLSGSGSIDFNYQQTIKQCVKAAGITDVTASDCIDHPADIKFPSTITKQQDDKTESATQKYQRELALYSRTNQK
jgi:hypothetical protein